MIRAVACTFRTALLIRCVMSHLTNGTSQWPRRAPGAMTFARAHSSARSASSAPLGQDMSYTRLQHRLARGERNDTRKGARASLCQAEKRQGKRATPGEVLTSDRGAPRSLGTRSTRNLSSDPSAKHVFPSVLARLSLLARLPVNTPEHLPNALLSRRRDTARRKKRALSRARRCYRC